MKTLVVIPTYNERENLAGLVEHILALPVSVDVLVVDDNSPDGTGQLADQLAADRPNRVFVLHRPSKNGLGTAYFDGFQWGLKHRYDALCEMDADGSHDPADLPDLIGAVEDGADLAIGSRRVRGGRIVGWNAWRHLMSWGANTISRLLLRLKTKDVTAGFRCIRADLIRRVLTAVPAAGGYAFQEESLFMFERSGARIFETPVVFVDRRKGSSKLGRQEIKEFFQTIVRLAGQRRR
jgi:glycosyltransferase involved in cell wall biosynthesis